MFSKFINRRCKIKTIKYSFSSLRSINNRGSKFGYEVSIFADQDEDSSYLEK
jgi:hypothetical protein